MDELLPELLDLIFSNLNCKSLIMIGRVCKKFEIKHIIENKKYVGFPRKEGKCKIHQFTDINLLKSPNKIEILSNRIYNDIKMDIVRGDFIIINEHNLEKFINYGNKYELFVFDGLKLIDLGGNKNITYRNTLLPKEFRVIENDIPINYWYNTKLTGIYDINSVWFDYSPVKDQCLNHIKYDSAISDSGQYCLYTNFEYKNDNYYIICDYIHYVETQCENINMETFEIENKNIKLLVIDKFRGILTSDKISFRNDLFRSIENALVIQL